MADAPNSYFSGVKDFFSHRFSFLDNYNRFVKRDKPLPSWSESDVQDFIASDPVHGPVLKTAREAVNYGLIGSAVGAVTTAGVCWKYSKSPHGAVLALGAGAVFGWTFGAEIGNHALQLYKLDTLTAPNQVYGMVGKENRGKPLLPSCFSCGSRGKYRDLVHRLQKDEPSEE